MIKALVLALFVSAAQSPAVQPSISPLPPLEPQTASGSVPPATVEEAIEGLVSWTDDPVLFVRQVFGAIPDAWQADALRAVAANPRVAMSACKGPGKSCTLAWVIWWFIATREDAQVIVTSITQPNLKDNLWKEVAFWQSKSPFLTALFDVKGERVTQRERPKTWWVSARAFAQDADATQQANTLAGFHGQHVLVVLDEVGDYPDGVVVAAEGIFANVVDAKLVVAGNPTRTDGPLYRIVTRDRKRWEVIHITGDPDDPKRSPRISLAWARQMIEDWGRDNDWVRVNVLGLFPNAAEDKLLGANDILTACGRDADPRAIESEPIIYGLDVARFGSDSSRLRCRQGPVLFRGATFRNLDGPTLAQRVAYIIERDSRERFKGRRPDYILVDVTGVGSSAYDHLCLLGFRDIAVPVDFGGGADDEAKFMDARAEMWWRMAAWVKKTGCLPSDSAELSGQLTAPTYKFRSRGKRTAFVLESKDDLRARGVPSPDDADAVALTFKILNPVRRDFRIEPPPVFAQGGTQAAHDYDPFAGR